MATIKSYTDIEQSRKLAEILPLESADMHWSKDFDGSWFVDLAEYASVKIPKYVVNVEEHVLPCWSLASLIGILPRYIAISGYTTFLNIYKTENLGWVIEYSNNKEDFVEICFDNHNLIDACYEMILKLNELKLL